MSKAVFAAHMYDVYAVGDLGEMCIDMSSSVKCDVLYEREEELDFLHFRSDHSTSDHETLLRGYKFLINEYIKNFCRLCFVSYRKRRSTSSSRREWRADERQAPVSLFKCTQGRLGPAD